MDHPNQQAGWYPYATWALVAAAVLYALLAGLRTVSDFDTGWQLATGRYVLQQHQIPYHDVFSYTSNGKPFIYPPFAGVLLYVVYLAGGFAALSWLNAIACAGTTALLLFRRGMATAVLALGAIPFIADRTAPRADLFTTLLFTATLLILWRWQRESSGPLWTLPLLMLFWVNLHLAFTAGLGLLAIYVFMEICSLPFAEQRQAAISRLRRSAQWLLATAVVTVINPWGWRIYSSFLGPSRDISVNNKYVGEWTAARLNSATLAQVLDWKVTRNWPLLVIVAVAAVVVALAQKRIGAAVLLAGAACASSVHIRFQALFAIVLVVLGGDLFGDGVSEIKKRFSTGAVLRYAKIAVTALALLFIMLRSVDLVTDRAYLANGEICLFGTGLSWWYPQRATQTILDEHLPPNLFNNYNSGGYVVFRLWPQYQDYIDGRAFPFSAELFQRHQDLTATPLDSAEWKQEADAHGINTVMFLIARYAGLESVPLQQNCHSADWAPVHIDDVSVVFVRRSALPQAAPSIQEVSCDSISSEPPETMKGESYRARAERYNFYANIGAIFYVLERDQDALTAFSRAEAIFSGDSSLYLSRGQLFQAEKKLAAAEAEYRRSLALRTTDRGWYSLGVVLAAQHRYPEAAECIENSAKLSQQPGARYRVLGQIYLRMNDPKAALGQFARARKSMPAAVNESEFRAQIAEGEASAWQMMGDGKQALNLQLEAVKLSPASPARWGNLAKLYAAQGMNQEAEEARRKADMLSGKAAATP